jgi:hypothetical protein
MGARVVNEKRKCPMCGSESWILLDGRSLFQARPSSLGAPPPDPAQPARINLRP